MHDGFNIINNAWNFKCHNIHNVEKSTVGQARKVRDNTSILFPGNNCIGSNVNTRQQRNVN